MQLEQMALMLKCLKSALFLMTIRGRLLWLQKHSWLYRHLWENTPQFPQSVQKTTVIQSERRMNKGVLIS